MIEISKGIYQFDVYSRQASKLQCEEFQGSFAGLDCHSRQVSKLQCEEFQESFAILKGDN